MTRIRSLGVFLMVVGLAVSASALGRAARADDAPTTRPTGQRAAPGMMINRLAENLGKLDLTPEQQEKADALLDDVRKQLMALRDQMPPDADRRAMGEKVREIFGGARQQLQDLLTPEQQVKLRDITQQQITEHAQAAGQGDPPPRPKPPEDSKPGDSKPASVKPVDAKPKDAPPVEDMMKPGVAKAVPPKTVKDAAATSSAAVEPGQPAPAFALKSLNGQPVTLATMKGRVVVVVFGSYSTPSFRQRVPAMEKLAKDYSTRAAVFVVYTREAHAVGEWEVDRNKDENIAVEQPKTDAERKTLAAQAVSTLKITVPVLLDDMENSTAKSYGLTPNGAVVINRDGTVAARQHWFEPIGLRAQIDAAISVKNVAKE